MPACADTGNKVVTITVGSLTDNSLTFHYTDGSSTAPTITSLSPSSQNPAIKGKINITGTGFGTNKAAVQLFLTNSSGRVYQLNVISVTDT